MSVLDRFRLDGKVALVTGGSRGLGMAFARADVAITARDPLRARAAVDLMESLGRRAIAVDADVTDTAQIASLVERVSKELGPIDVLVNNAGISEGATALEVTEEAWQRVLDVNLNGVWRTSRAVGEQMVARGTGSIINIGSMSGMIVNRPRWQPAYLAAKAAVHQLTKALAAEWAPHGVRVNALAPGYFLTEASPVDQPEYQQWCVDPAPMRRFGMPDELGPAVVFLASEASSFMTGSVVVIDGGYTLFWHCVGSTTHLRASRFRCAILVGVALKLGTHVVDPPVVLAPMAGITNVAFRQLCREQGAGLFVCEMITTVALHARNPKTDKMIEFGPDEHPRSMQIYGVDPDITAKAVRRIVDENLADHIDMNFGCSVKKITSKGGGSAIPYKRKLFGSIVQAAVDAATPAGIPVTIKMRKGIDDDHLTYLEAGLIAQDAGVKWVALHARTAAQRYSGTADWESIGALKQALDIPVLGNGDIWEAEHALRMVAETGCDGVVVGRGCLGRPWLFADLAAAFDGRSERAMPSLGEVAAVMRRHAELLAHWWGKEREAVTDFRKHVAWYLKGFPAGSELRRAMAMASSLAELDDLLGKLDHDAPFPQANLGQPRGRTNAPARVVLPHNWLQDKDDCTVPEDAEHDDSGG